MQTGEYVALQVQFLYVQLRLAPHHLQRLRQALPHHPGAQDVVAVNYLLQGAHKSLHTLDTVKRQMRLQQVGIALRRREVVIENPLLQRRQRVDILHVGGAARHLGHHLVDGRLVEAYQSQHVLGDALAIGTDAIGRHLHFAATADSGGQRG